MLPKASEKSGTNMLNNNFMFFFVTDLKAIFFFRFNIEMSKKIIRALKSMFFPINGKCKSTGEPIPLK